MHYIYKLDVMLKRAKFVKMSMLILHRKGEYNYYHMKTIKAIVELSDRSF